MATQPAKVIGGNKTTPYLNALVKKMTGGASGVRVGYLEGATYPVTRGKKTLHVAQVAYWNEFGTATAKARPHFRNMIIEESPSWGGKFAKVVKATSYDGPRALALMGEYIRDRLVKRIVDWPADNAPSTVAKKGFNKGLVDKGIMQRAPDWELV